MNILNLFIIFIYISENTAKHYARTNGSRKLEKNHPTRICETSKMDVHLIELSGFFIDRENEGFIDITLPTSARHRPLFVCFPHYFHQYRQTYLLGHAACRQLGFATATSVIGKRIPTDSFAMDDDIGPTTSVAPLPRGLSPVSWNCVGHEQNVAQCAWYNIRMEGCQMLTELACGECQRIVKAPSGFIKSPGYPVAHFFDMTCEWDIEVPESHLISLVFHYLNPLPQGPQCTIDKPYLDITYGAQGSFHVRRHCDFKRLQNITIPYHKVQIRFFSGLYDPKINIRDSEQGLAISFKAISTEPYPLAIDVTIVVVIVLIAFVGLFFIGKTIRYRVKYDRAAAAEIAEIAAIAQGIEDMDKAYEFQRCHIQPAHNKSGLRLRSNGSRSNLPSIRIHEPTISNQIYTTFRKFSSNALTPRTIIPSGMKSSQSRKAKLQAIYHLKANLLDRYSSGGNRGDSVFFPASNTAFDFPIYHSTSTSVSKQDLPMKTLRLPLQETAI